MKILLICEENQALHLPMRNGFKKLGHDVQIVDPKKLLNKYQYFVKNHVYRFPFVFREKYDRIFYDKINAQYSKVVRKYSPDIVLIYNHGWLLPETVLEFNKFSKVFYYIVDSPFHSAMDVQYLISMKEADHVFSMDSMWIEQLKLVGIEKTTFLITGLDYTTFNRVPPPVNMNDFMTDIIFIGNSPGTVSGYKRALFLSKFSKFNFKLHGNPAWEKWFNHFPELKKNYIKKTPPYSYEKVNLLYNCAKLAPVDTYTGVLRGPHPKIFDCIGAGVLPLVEYRMDTERIFDGLGLPLIYNYDGAPELVEYYLSNEKERVDLIDTLYDFILNNYTSVHFAEKILSYY